MKDLIIVRGAGDLGTGIISKLHAVGWKVLALECPEPMAIRRHVAFSEAVWEGFKNVEDIQVHFAGDPDQAVQLMASGHPVVMVDPRGDLISSLKPLAVVDATLIKENIGTKASMAPIVIGVGPGHIVGEHCHAAVESARGHNLGRVYYSGTPMVNTGIPGNISGYSSERVIHAPEGGRIKVLKDIAQLVKAGDVVAMIGETPVRTVIAGVVRGMLRDGVWVSEGMKMADVDPRLDQIDNCNTISDKARCIAGGVLEALMTLERKLEWV